MSNTDDNLGLEYIHVPSIGQDIEAVRTAGRAAKAFVESRYADGKIEGFRLLVMNRQEKVDNNLIFSDLKAITKGQFPFLYVIVQHWDGKPDQQAIDWMLENDFAQVQQNLG